MTFENGLPVKLELTENGKSKTVTDPLEIFLSANSIARYACLIEYRFHNQFTYFFWQGTWCWKDRYSGSLWFVIVIHLTLGKQVENRFIGIKVCRSEKTIRRLRAKHGCRVEVVMRLPVSAQHTFGSFLLLTIKRPHNAPRSPYGP